MRSRRLCPENVGWAVPTTADTDPGTDPVGTARPTGCGQRELCGRSRSRHRFRLAAVFLGLCLVAAFAWPAVAADDQAEFETSDIFVPMSDGIELATTVYRPKGDGPFPVIVARTPYNKD